MIAAIIRAGALRRARAEGAPREALSEMVEGVEIGGQFVLVECVCAVCEAPSIVCIDADQKSGCLWRRNAV